MIHFFLVAAGLSLISFAGAGSSSRTSWTFHSASPSMPWTPLVDTQLTVASMASAVGNYDLLVVVVPNNTTDLDELNGNSILDDDDDVSSSSTTTAINNLLEAKTKSVVRIMQDSNGTMSRILVIQLPPTDAKDQADGGALGRKVATSIVAALKAEKGVTSCGIQLLLPNVTASEFLSECSSSILSGLYSDTRYKSSGAVDELSKTKPSVKWIEFVVPNTDNISLSSKAVERGSILARGIYLSKDIVNAPHNSLNSYGLAATAKQIAAESNGRLSCQILETQDCEKRGMGAFLGVARGSETYPKMIHLTYRPKRKGTKKNPLKKLGVVGKGLLFDTGGYNIKTMMMELMKFDCGGAAAVLGAAQAIAALQPEGVEVHFVIAACENMINERAVVPGDILTAANGKTIEVINTDAEGRLTMADALVYIDKEVGCESIIELSTLTGSCIGALGSAMAGIWTDDEDLLEGLKSASKATGEKVWQLPLEKEYNEQIKSKIADLKNIGGRYAGAITAALFLTNFVEDKPFAHIDMAGPVWNVKSGATGWGAKLVTEWVCQNGAQAL